MRFLQVDTISGARERLLQEVGDNFLKVETVKLSQAYGKCLAEDIYAEENIPDFRRATVDGYAVKASDTHGAGESVPVFLFHRKPCASRDQKRGMRLCSHRRNDS